MMAQLSPMGMIFVPSVAGISHSPKELTRWDDCANGANVLLAADPPPQGQPPGIIDMAPYWRPAGFALAVFAYWIGPWRNRPDLLARFAHVEQLDQLLIRAGIRMLLIMSEFGRLTDMAWYTRATKMIVERNGA